MSFFAGCSNFEVIGGTFNEIHGNLNQYGKITRREVRRAHTYATGWNGNADPHDYGQVDQVPSNAYPPERSSSQSAANGDVWGQSLPGSQSSGFIRIASDPRISYPERDLTAQIQRDARASAQPPPELLSYQPPPPRTNKLTHDSNVPPRTSRTAPPSLTMPISQPEHRGSRDDSLSSSPEQMEAPWRSFQPQGPPPRAQIPRVANTQPTRSAPMAPLPATSASFNNPTTYSDWNQDDSDSSDSEDEDVWPATWRRVPSSNGGSNSRTH